MRVSVVIGLLVTVTALLIAPAKAADDGFAGAEEVALKTCTLHSESAEIPLDFKRVIDRYLYRYGLTPRRTFTLRLGACDSQVLTGAKLRLIGKESTELSGRLALDGTGGAKGVVIGLQAENDQALPINGSDALIIPRAPSGMSIALQAYLEAEPSAQSSRNVLLQHFSATAFVVLDYR